MYLYLNSVSPFICIGFLNKMSMKELIWKRIAEMYTPGFFITADIMDEDTVEPIGLEAFVVRKIDMISQGIKARKFVFQSGMWRIYLTFFPTDKVVDERYALKNKIIKQREN